MIKFASSAFARKAIVGRRWGKEHLVSRIGIVTDSTADMPDGYYKEHEVAVVPLYVRFGDKVYRDWLDMKPKEFYTRMRLADELPKTSQPSVEDFLSAYRWFEGYDGVVSIHLSGELSGTVQSAKLAAEQSPVPVRVVDGRQASIATGFVLDVAVKARDEGKDLVEIESIAKRASEEIKIAFTVDSLRYLEMGGRIGKAKYLAASLLKIRPVLTLVDGVVGAHKAVKGRSRLIGEMVDLIGQSTAGKSVHIGYAHADCPESVDEMREAVRAAGINVASEIISEIGCVIGTYVGPGGYAMVIRPT